MSTPEECRVTPEGFPTTLVWIKISSEFQSSDVEAGDLKTSEIPSFLGRRIGLVVLHPVDCLKVTLFSMVRILAQVKFFSSYYCKFVATSMLCAFRRQLILIGCSCNP